MKANFTVLIKNTALINQSPFVLVDQPDQLAHGDQFQVLPKKKKPK